ncbi:hypothetical protein Glove_194g142 [Diversispora epigaea]|uniref:Uncharacterized protein n=1 Tax=Diversispora epigaea TaxID=1348612 RepID=A0A397IPG1_9GLOM|nr:hypothetical protein Glove_194g142 [Diversispora epigaea]
MAEEEDGMDEKFSDISIRGGVEGIINLRYPEIPDLRYETPLSLFLHGVLKNLFEFQLILFQRPRLIPSLFLNASFIPHERSWNLRDKKLRKGYHSMSLWDLIIGHHLEHKKSDEGLLCDVKCNTCLFFAGGIEHLKKHLAWQELSSNSDVFSSPNLIQPHLDTKVIGKINIRIRLIQNCESQNRRNYQDLKYNNWLKTTKEHKCATVEGIKSTIAPEIIKKQIVSVQKEDGQIELSKTICKELDIPLPKLYLTNGEINTIKPENIHHPIVIEELKQELNDIKKKKETSPILTNVDKGTVLVVSTAVLTATVYTHEEGTKNKNANMKKQRNRNKKNVKRKEN